MNNQNQQDQPPESAPAVASSVGLGRHNMKITLEWNGESSDRKRAFVGAQENDGFRALRIDVDTDDCDREHAMKMMHEVIDRCNRAPELEDLLTSARCIAQRNGENTAWKRFDERLEKAGIGTVTAKVFKVLPSDAP